jgi:hypothetical protein
MAGLNWFFSITPRQSPTSRSTASPRGGIAVQHRMAYQGEYSSNDTA